MSLHLITGHAGRQHVSAADHGAFNAALLLSGSFVLNAGKNFSAQVVTSNSIKISDGELVMQGRHVRLNPGKTEEVTIANGQQDYKRNDLIVARYIKDGTYGTENVSFVVIQGEPNVSKASDPAYIEGNILNGVLTADFPLYRVPLDGLNVGALVPLFEVKDSFDKRIADILDGTKQVGDTKKLGGVNAELYALLTDLKNYLGINETAADSNKLGGKNASDYFTKDGGKLDGTVFTQDAGTDAEWVGHLRNKYGVTFVGGTVGADENYRVIAILPRTGMDGIATEDARNALQYEYNDGDGVTRFQILHTGNMANHVLPLTGGTVYSETTPHPLFIDNGDNSNDLSLLLFRKSGTNLGFLGFSGLDNPVILRNDGAPMGKILHESNYFNYALPLTGGTVTGDTRFTSPSGNGSLIPYTVIGGAGLKYDYNNLRYGSLEWGLSKVLFKGLDTGGTTFEHELHHDGNSAKVAVKATAPDADVWIW